MPPWRVALSLGLFPSLSACVLSTVVLSCFDTTHLSLSVFPSSPFSFFLLPFCFYEWFASVHRCQLSRIIIQWKNVVSLSNYKIRCECTLHAVHFLRLIAIFFLAAISCAISTQTKNPSKNPLCSKTRDRVSYLFDFYIFITTIYESFVIFDLIKAVVNKSI